MKLSLDQRLWCKRLALIVIFSATVLAITMLSRHYQAVSSASTSAFLLLIIVVIAAFVGDAAIAIITSLSATLCFDYFCLPPFGTFTITAFPDILSLIAFLLTSITISGLTASAARHGALARTTDRLWNDLKEFEARLLLMPGDRLSLSKIAEETLRAFSLEYCSIRGYTEGKWYHCTGSAMRDISKDIETSGLKLFRDHPTDLLELAEENMLGVKYARVNLGAVPHALVAVKSDSMPVNALGVIAGIIGLKILEASPNRAKPS